MPYPSRQPIAAWFFFFFLCPEKLMELRKLQRAGVCKMNRTLQRSKPTTYRQIYLINDSRYGNPSSYSR
jgi:hypothetical protein